MGPTSAVCQKADVVVFSWIAHLLSVKLCLHRGVSWITRLYCLSAIAYTACVPDHSRTSTTPTLPTPQNTMNPQEYNGRYHLALPTEYNWQCPAHAVILRLCRDDIWYLCNINLTSSISDNRYSINSPHTTASKLFRHRRLQHRHSASHLRRHYILSILYIHGYRSCRFGTWLRGVGVNLRHSEVCHV